MPGPLRSTLFPYTTLFRSRWLFDHAETVTGAELQRIKRLGGGIAVQFRMYYQGELYKKMYGEPDHQIPPIKKMISMGIPVDRKSTRLNSSHQIISYAVFCLKHARTSQIYPLSLHDALPISLAVRSCRNSNRGRTATHKAVGRRYCRAVQNVLPGRIIQKDVW